LGNLLFDIVSEEIVKVLNISITDIYCKLEVPPCSDIGDVALPCFSFAKTLKKSPQSIAEDIQVKLLEQNRVNKQDVFSEILVSGGYLNFYLNRSKLIRIFYKSVCDGLLLDKSDNEGKKITVEHTSINPNASPHIGRARNAFIGDASVRLLRFLGFNVTVHYLVNDIGKQIALLVCCINYKENIEFNELLSLYIDANEQLKTNSELEKDVFNILNRMENGDEEVFAQFTRIVDICLKGQTQILNEIGIFYDKYDRESQYVISKKTEKILACLKTTGRLFEDKEGRLVLDLSEFNINSENPYLPLTRKDKTSLYPLRDICYNIDKHADDTTRNIVILGQDQRLYGLQINAALSLLGKKGAEIINYSFVLLPEGKMSTRKGQVILLEDLMHDTTIYAKNAIEERYGSAYDDALPKQLSYGAIKYSILKCGNDKNVVFDRDSALNFEGNTSVYIQYSFARIQSLLKNENLDVNINDVESLVHAIEWEIIKKIFIFNQILNTVSQDFNFAPLCSYLFDLSRLFSRWYTECPIKTSNAKLKSARLFLASSIANIIKSGLDILGIDTPEKI